MMKTFVSKNIIAACVAGVTILCTPKASVAQVDMSLLTEVANSCKRDVFSTEYYQQLGHKDKVNTNDYAANWYLSDCIQSRYLYSQVLYKFPWLASTEEMLPGYPGSVAVSLITYINDGSDIIDCLASQDKNSEECSESDSLKALYRGYIDGMYKMNLMNTGGQGKKDNSYGYMCSSCYVAYNNYPSGRKMIGAFIEWFMGLEPSHRKELMSILGDEETARTNRDSMYEEATRAWYEYEDTRERIAEEEKAQRRRELFE